MKNTTGEPIPLETRLSELRGWTLTPQGIVGPSGTMYEHMQTEAFSWEFVRRVATDFQRATPPEHFARIRARYTFVDAMRESARRTANGTFGKVDEAGLANVVLVWVTASTLGATWEQVLPERPS